MADHRTFDPNVPIRDFKAELDTCMMTGMCGRPYIRVAKLIKWLKSEASPGSRVSQVERLLYAAYHDRIELPISIRQVCRSDNCSLLVFSILLELGYGGLFDRFQRQGIVDKHLPIDLRNLKYLLEPLRLPNATELAGQFDRKQWAYCAVKFDLYLGQDYPKNRIIPICSKEEINTKGGTARLWQIEVQEEFVGQQLREVVSTSSFDSPHDDFGPRYQFALKTFQDGNREFYENEREAFRALQNHEGMVRYLDDYGHKEIQPLSNTPHSPARDGPGDDVKTVTTYNLLLEFGELDLDEYFACRQPPVLQVEIQAFWKDLFEVADAVKGIHNFEKLRAGVRQEYFGWHADIKPDNILIVQGKFKLADPGFARFEKKTDQRKNTIVPGGTRTFAAPECDPGRGTQAPVPRTIDIWSLGCVFSIAATWVVLGYHGIQQFHKIRQRAIKKIVQKRRIEPRPGEHAVHLSQGDYFHDGIELLEDIKHWHNYLRGVLRRTDTITSQVLDLVDRNMLRGIAKERVEAKDLCAELKEISVRGQTKLAQSLPESIMVALLEVDEKAPSQPIGPGSPRDASSALSVGDSQDRKARKSKLLDLPFMKTTHRSEYLKSELRAQSDVSGAFDVVYESPIEEGAPLLDRPSSNGSGIREGEYFTQMNSPYYSPKAKDRRPRNASLNLGMSGTSISAYANQHAIPKKNTRQTVFQARADIERRQKKDFVLRRTPRDELLTRYFGNRDIKFLVDNAESMGDYWDEAIFVLETLVMKAKGQDEDGMDLSFTGGPIRIENKTKPSDFKKAMEDPKAKPMGHTDMTAPLGDIFDAYLNQAGGSVVQRTRVKKLTLIILTDGIWEGMSNKDEVDIKIITFVKALERATASHQNRPVSIQFIQFGNDADATYRLRHLDDDLPYSDVPDIVDTEHSTGDVNKMLLGSFVEEYDNKDEGSLSPPGSPTNPFDPPEPLPRPMQPMQPMQPMLAPEQILRTSPPQMSPGPYQPPGIDQIQRSNSTSTRLPGTQRTPSFFSRKPSGHGFREHKYNR